MKNLPFILCLLLAASLPQAGKTATLPDTQPYIITVSFDRTLTLNQRIRNTSFSPLPPEVRDSSIGAVQSFKYRVNTSNTFYFSQSGSRVFLETEQFSLGYNAVTQGGRLDLGYQFPYGLSYGYSFSGVTGTGTYWYEDDEVPFFTRQSGVLSNVSVTVTTPAAVPLPASLPLLLAGLFGLRALRRRR